MEKLNSSKQANPVVIAVITLLRPYCVPLLSIQSLTFYFPRRVRWTFYMLLLPSRYWNMFCVCVCRCAHVHAGAHGLECMYMCLWRPEVSFRCSSLGAGIYLEFWDKIFHDLGLTIILGCLSSNPRDPPFSTFKVLIWQACGTRTGSFMGFCVSKLRSLCLQGKLWATSSVPDSIES